jgi:tetratricopeptide (TPR) repeat protein
MGYAHIMSNKGYFDEAIDYYERVFRLRHDWVRPLECMAYIFEYKKNIKNKAAELCNKILTLEPNNRVATFVLSRHIA